MGDYMITTIDNPWNPFTHYHEWLDHDTQHGYHTDQWIAILSKSSSDLPMEEQEELVDFGCQRLLEVDPYGLHVKLYPHDADILIPIYNKVYRDSVAV